MTWLELVSGLFAGGSKLAPRTCYRLLGDLTSNQRAKVRQTIQVLRARGVLYLSRRYGSYQLTASLTGHCACGKLAVDGKASCSRCLDRAARHFRERAASLLADGQCINNCGRQPQPGQQRCVECAEHYRGVRNDWGARDGNEAKARAQHSRRRRILTDAGFCPYCAEHRPVALGRRACAECLKRRQAQKARVHA